MKHLATQFRHWVTSLAAIGTYLLSLGLLEPSQVEAANQAGQQMVDPLVALFDPLSAIISLLVATLVRCAISWLGDHFPSFAERLGNKASGGMSGGASLLIICTAALSMAGLPSCSSLSEYPITGSIFYRDPNSGAKGGLTFTPGSPATATVKIPIYDGDGKMTGYADLTGPLSREVRAEK